MSKYESGTALAAVAATSAALIDGAVPPEVVERIWRAQHDASGGDALGAALGILVDVFGVTALPSFALAVMGDEGTRVVVRGGFEAVIDGGDHAGETVQATGPTFWAERHVADATGVLVQLPGDQTIESLPIVDGVVRARAVALGTADRGGEILGGSTDARRRRRSPDASSRSLGTVPLPAAPIEVSPAEPSSRVGAPAGADQPTDQPMSTVPTPTPLPSPASTPTPMSEAVEALGTGAGSVDGELGTEPSPTEAPTTSTRSGETWSLADDTFSNPSESASSSLPVEEGTTSYDDLIFGHTRAASVEDAAVRATEELPISSQGIIGQIPSVGGPDGSDPLGDHDGLTLSVEQLAALRAERGTLQAAPSVPSVPEEAGTDVILVTSTGARVALDRGAVVGLSPSAVRATGTVPHLVAVPSPLKQISRRHLEIRVEAAHVLAVDLDSSNGTRLLRVGAEPVRLHPGAPTLLVSGDRLDLGEGVEVSFEGLR